MLAFRSLGGFMKIWALASLAFLSTTISLTASASTFTHFLIEKRIEQKRVAKKSKKEFTRVTQSTFDQALDHFDASNKTTFKQRYYVTTEYSGTNANAPVIYYQCGEGNCLDSHNALAKRGA
jgi:hypothetical protein